MATIKHPDTQDIAGDYNLSHIDLINHDGITMDLKYIVIELNIYESIYKNAVTGSVVITDARNQIGRLEIQGLERIAFKLSTPGTNKKRDTIDASAETGEPFHVCRQDYRICLLKMLETVLGALANHNNDLLHY